MKQNNKKLNNKGFTLVEVLIAITILAIIVGPLLHSFVTAAKTNAKAKEVLRATTVGQNVMEEIKAYSLEEIARQFNHDTTATPAKNYSTDTSIVSMAGEGGYEVIDPSAANYSVVDAADPQNPDNNIGKFVGQEDGNYEFCMQKVSHESKNFDIKININKAANGTKNISNIMAMNRSDCAYYAQNSSQDSYAAFDFAAKNDNYGSNAIESYTANDFLQTMSREITVLIEADGTGNQSVQVNYKYTAPSGYVAPGSEEYTEYSNIFDNYASNEQLKAVYVYYYPLYGTTNGRTDSFQIINESNLDVDVYLIRMKNADYTAFNDAAYNPYVYVTEKEEGLGTSSAVTLCTNVRCSNGIYNGVYSHNVSGVSVNITDLGNTQATDCYYDVTITVYKHNSSNPFTGEDKVATFTGSLLDTGMDD